MIKYSFIVLCFIFPLTSVAQLGPIGVNDCGRMPAFVSNVGLEEPVVIDTTVVALAGVVLRELAGQKRMYRHTSWKVSGHVGTTVRDAAGNIYTIPIPTIDLQNNPLERRNHIYKIGAKSGLMSVFAELPLPNSASQENPFGTLGITIDCRTQSLYVSSVAGSSPEEVNGVIYQIDVLTGKVIDTLEGYDAIGLAIVQNQKEKRLYFGDARSSSVYSVPMTASGKFLKPSGARYELSLLHVKNGDSTQAKKIKVALDSERRSVMTVSESEFSFRMHAGTSAKYRHYNFLWSEPEKKWIFDGFK